METPPPPNLNSHVTTTTAPVTPATTTATATITTTATTINTTTTATIVNTGPLPKFFILHSLSDKTLGAMSAFVVDKCLQGLVGTVQVKKLRSGDLQVETPSDLASRSLMRVDAIDGVPISVTPHRTLNSSKGVIVSRDLLTDTEEDIQMNLEAQGVISVKRIMLRRDGGLTPSNVHILTFNTPVLPGSVKAGYLRCTVRPYIPNPLRCFLCQRYGHSRNVCRGSPICARCAKGDHDFDNCKLDPVCANCQGAHPAYSRTCPKWQSEKAVQQYRVENKVSYPEARRVLAPANSNRPLYSAVVQKQMVTSEVQTDVTVCPYIKSPIMEILDNSSNSLPCSHCNPPRSTTTSTTTIVTESQRASTSDAQTRASELDAHKEIPVPQKEPVMAPKGGKGNKPAPQGQAKQQIPASQRPLIKAACEKRGEMPAPERQAPKKAMDSGRVSGPPRGTKPSSVTKPGAESSAPNNSSSDIREASSSSESEVMSCVESSSKRALSPGRERSPFRAERAKKKTKKKGRVPVTPP